MLLRPLPLLPLLLRLLLWLRLNRASDADEGGPLDHRRLPALLLPALLSLPLLLLPLLLLPPLLLLLLLRGPLEGGDFGSASGTVLGRLPPDDAR